MSLQDLRDKAAAAVQEALDAGAREAVARMSGGVAVSVSRRGGRVERSTESRSTSLGLRLLVDDRFSSHGTSDLRPEAVKAFIRRAVEATRFLEADPDRALAPREDCGAADADLDLDDPRAREIETSERQDAVAGLEDAVLERRGRGAMRSCTAHWSDGYGESAVVFSNGFEGAQAASTFGMGVELSLEDEGGRLPEATTWYGCSHQEDLPPVPALADEAWERALSRLGSGAVESGRYPLLLDRRVVGRLLGTLLSPMSGFALHLGRSCLTGRLAQRIASPALTITDDPLVPRASGSFLFDADGFPARRRVLLDGGVLSTFLLDLYHARRLGMEPTGGSTGNIVIQAGPRSPAAIAAAIPRAILVESFLGGNSNSTTGDFSFGIRGALLESGVRARAVSEMNVSGNLFELLERFTEAADDTWTYGSWRVPTLLFNDIQFSGT